MRTTMILLCALLFAFTASAQDRPPVKDATGYDEMITMTGDTPFSKAMNIFSNSFKRFGQKPLVYEEPDGKKGGTIATIGINIPNMYWRDAFELVLRVNNHWYIENPDYVRVYSMGKVGTGDTLSTRAAVNTREVEISAIFFEANRSEMEQLGIDWSFTNTTPSSSIQVGVSNTGSASAGTSGSSGSSTTQTVDYGLSSKLHGFTNALDVMAALKAIQSENLGELISAPSITVRSQEKGRIQVGQDFSVKQRDFSGNTTDKFYSAGTIIEVTPTIMTYDSLEFIHLLISAERSSVLPDPVSTIINKTAANTSVILLDQEETVVGGLYTNDVQQVRRGVPFLKDLPGWVLGLRYLFGYDQDQVAKKELIIILKARIVPSIQQRAAAKVAEIQRGQKALENEYERIDVSRGNLLKQIEAAKARFKKD